MFLIAVPHSLTEENEYNGMRIPKDLPSSETHGKSSLRANATLEILTPADAKMYSTQ
jgi:hypothetical protein